MDRSADAPVRVVWDPAPPGSDHERDAFTLHQIRDDIYHTVGSANLAVGCNGTIIVNEKDVLSVDSHMTPAASWALLGEIKRVTDKPVRYVVNNHVHFDHVHAIRSFPSGGRGQHGRWLHRRLARHPGGAQETDFEYVLPGHGEAFTDKRKIDAFQTLLTDLPSQIEEKQHTGVNATDPAETIDLGVHAESFPDITGPGVDRR